MEKKDSNFTTLKKWLIQRKEMDKRFDLEMKDSLSKSGKVTLFEKILAYSIVVIVVLFVISLKFI